MSKPSFSGRRIYDPEAAEQAEQRQSQLLATLGNIGRQLQPGITQAAPRTPEYLQNDRRTCFYASLIGIRKALYPNTPHVPEYVIAEQAQNEGLLGTYGAETFPEFQEQQTEFVKTNLGLGINFIDQRQDIEQIDALTVGMLHQRRPLVFGTRGHWIVLDGFLKSDEKVFWTGMDPGIGSRLEGVGRELSTETILEKMRTSGQPLVVVQRSAEAEPVRFRSAAREVVRFAKASQRFGPAEPKD